MRRKTQTLALLPALALAALLPGGAAASVNFQCPSPIANAATGQTEDPNVYCKHLTASDGFATMADGRVLYTFGFRDVTGVNDDAVVEAGMLGAQFSAPTLKFPEGAKVYLTLTNVGMMMRPDLFDPHSIHWHGFPNAAPIFDGEPMSSISIVMGASLTYYYEAPTPGTYMYHCHVEATEHMQMGMLGNLCVTPGQDRRAPGAVPGHLNNGDVDEPPYGDWPGVGDVDLNDDGTFDEGTVHGKYAYDDGDGSTRYDVDYPIQLVSFDPLFHQLHIDVQPLPFAKMVDTYPMINGRGYPDTIELNPLPAPAENGGKISQPVSALITATQGQRILLRISSLSTVEYYTVGLSGLTMRVVGKDARLLRSTGASPVNLSYATTSVEVGGGQSVDAIIDTAGVAPGTYFLYTKNLNHLSNDAEDFGGMMTEIVISAAP
jgi:FtsP/CotA-like multicopper oxidase with cupredoxin domain